MILPVIRPVFDLRSIFSSAVRTGVVDVVVAVAVFGNVAVAAAVAAIGSAISDSVCVAVTAA